MSVTEQLSTVASSDILVGVQGAGLQWAIFMSPNFTLIEIVWPQKYWGVFYSFIPNYRIQHRTMTANDVQVNWESYELNLRNGKVCSPVERLSLLNKPPTSETFDNIWKWADVLADVKGLQIILKGLA